MELLIILPFWYIISLILRLMCQSNFYRLGLEQLSFLIATPIPCDYGKWKVRALVFGIFPIPLKSTQWPWPHYTEECARRAIKMIRSNPEKWFVVEEL